MPPSLVAQRRLHPEFLEVARDGLTLEKPASLDRLVKWARNPNPLVENGSAYVWLVEHGRITEALEIFDRRTRDVRIPYDCLRLNPKLASLRRDPRFQPILARARGQFEELLVVLDEARARGEFPQYFEKPLADLRVQLQ